MKKLLWFMLAMAALTAASFGQIIPNSINALPCSSATCIIPGWQYCTVKSYYVESCNTQTNGYIAFMDPNTNLQGWERGNGGGCGAHTWHVQDVDHHAYAIIDQYKTNGGRIYPRPPNSAPNAQVVWDKCVNSHISPAGTGSTSGGYYCDGSIHPQGGVQNYVDITLNDPRMPQNLRTSFSNVFNCDVPPTPTATPPFVITPTPGSGQCICVTVTPKVP